MSDERRQRTTGRVAQAPDPGSNAAGAARAVDRLGASASDGETRKPRPTHYKVVCLSLYTTDLHELDRKIDALKQHGWSRANRSHLVRIALSRLSNDEIAAIAEEQRGRR